VEEFLEELTKSPPNIDLVVRGTVSYTSGGAVPTLQSVSVIATYIRSIGLGDESLLVKLETYCGQHWGFGESDKKTMDRAENILKQIEDKVKQLDLHWRAGVYE